MQQGSTETTGLASDMAIDGQGFFVVRTSDMRQAYTRDGSFMLNSDNYLVTADGNYVQGYGVDSSYNLVPGVLSDLKIPLGRLTAAKATSTAQLEGNLSSAGTVGTQGSTFLSNPLVSGTGVATGATLLTDLRDAAAAGVPLFANGDVIKVSGVTEGSRRAARARQHLRRRHGRHHGGRLHQLAGRQTRDQYRRRRAGQPGRRDRRRHGVLSITGNIGEDNALTNLIGSITNQTAGGTHRSPLPREASPTAAASTPPSRPTIRSARRWMSM